MRSLIVIFAILVVVPFAAHSAIETQTDILSQSGCPVRIIAYTAVYKNDVSTSGKDGAYHTVQYINGAKMPIVAIEFGMVSFSVWDEFMCYNTGLEVGQLASAPPIKRAGSVIRPTPERFMARSSLLIKFAWRIEPSGGPMKMK